MMTTGGGKSYKKRAKAEGTSECGESNDGSSSRSDKWRVKGREGVNANGSSTGSNSQGGAHYLGQKEVVYASFIPEQWRKWFVALASGEEPYWIMKQQQEVARQAWRRRASVSVGSAAAAAAAESCAANSLRLELQVDCHCAGRRVS